MQSRHRDNEATISRNLSKPAMLALTTGVVVAVVMPLLIPHLAHPSMAYHSILHLASLSIAVFLGIVSTLAYMRSKTSRLLFMMLGFIALAAVELFYLLDTTGAFLELSSFAALDIELPHIILLVMLCMFGLGVIKVNNK